MTDLVLNTKESMYEPITVMIDGIEYKCEKRLTPPVLEKLAEFQLKALKENDEDATYNMIIYLFPKMTKEIFLTLDIRELRSITELVSDRIMNPQKGLKKKT